MPGCVYGVVVCACTGTRGSDIRLRWCCCVSGLCSCSLLYNSIDEVGAAASAVRVLMRAASGRRLDEFVRGIGVTSEEEEREASIFPALY